MVLCGPWICLKNKYLQKWQKKQNKIKIFQKSLEDCAKRSGKKKPTATTTKMFLFTGHENILHLVLFDVSRSKVPQP